MTQEDKDLLLRDLCARLPYGMKVQYQVGSQLPDIKVFNGKQYDELRTGSYLDDWLKCTFKPYLFPLSSMTEEQKYICPIGVGNLETFIEKESWAYLELSFDSILRFIDWLNKNHFDYRGLIEKGLAIDCTNLNIY